MCRTFGQGTGNNPLRLHVGADPDVDLQTENSLAHCQLSVTVSATLEGRVCANVGLEKVPIYILVIVVLNWNRVQDFHLLVGDIFSSNARHIVKENVHSGARMQ